VNFTPRAQGEYGQTRRKLALYSYELLNVWLGGRAPFEFSDYINIMMKVLTLARIRELNFSLPRSVLLFKGFSLGNVQIH